MIRALTILLLLSVPGAGCDRPQSDRRPGAKKRPAPPGARPGAAMRAAAMGQSRTAPARLAPKPGMNVASTRQQACRAMYRKRLVDLVKPLGRLGLQHTADGLVQLYGLDGERALHACLALTAEQRACLDKQPNPLLADQACRLSVPLSLAAPAPLTRLLTPPPVALSAKAAKRRLASLVGTWAYASPAQRRKVTLVLTPAGEVTRQRQRQGTADGPPERSTFSFTDRLGLIEQRGATTLRHVFFRLGPDHFALSPNPRHNVVRLPDRQRFRLLVTGDRVLVVEGGRCHVVDLAHLATHAASCQWVGDDQAAQRELRVDYKLGSWPVSHRYVLLRGHLLHHRLLERRYARQ